MATERKPWRARDDAKLRRLYCDRTSQQVAIQLGRTIGAVYVRAHFLGLKKSDAQRANQLADAQQGRRKAHQAAGAPIWNKQRLALLKKHYPTMPGNELAALLGIRVSQLYARAVKMGIKKDREALRRHNVERVRALRESGRAHRFKKGNVPPNKGIKGWQAGGRAAETQFKPGKRPHTYKPIGSLRENDGYLYVKLSDHGYVPADWIPLHRAEWERLNGPLPEGYIVLFKDGDKRNFAADNLVAISKADNMRRNTIHNLPTELRDTIMTLGQLKRRINERDRGQEQHPDAGRNGTPRASVRDA